MGAYFVFQSGQGYYNEWMRHVRTYLAAEPNGLATSWDPPTNFAKLENSPNWLKNPHRLWLENKIRRTKNDVIIRPIAFSSHVLYRYGKRLKSEGASPGDWGGFWTNWNPLSHILQSPPSSCGQQRWPDGTEFLWAAFLASSAWCYLITGTVIPFHIHNVVAQLHQNGELRSAELFDVFFFLMGQVLPHASPVFSQNPVFFIFSVNFPLSTFWALLRYPEFHHLSRNFQPKQRPNAVKHRTRHRGM